MAPVAAWAATGLLVVLAAFQFCLAGGAPWGRLAWGGGHRVLPGGLRVASAATPLLYAVMAWVLLSRAGVLSGDADAWVAIAAWVVAGVLLLSVVGNLASRSRAERWTMGPLSMLLAAAAGLVASG